MRDHILRANDLKRDGFYLFDWNKKLIPFSSDLVHLKSFRFSCLIVIYEKIKNEMDLNYAKFISYLLIKYDSKNVYEGQDKY